MTQINKGWIYVKENIIFFMGFRFRNIFADKY